MKVNSTGSVIPVRKQVSAAENRIPAAIFIFGMRFMIHRQTRRRQGKQHQREFTLHELTGVLVGVAAEGFHPFFQHLEPDGLVAVDHRPPEWCNHQMNTRKRDTRYGADRAG